MDMEYRAKDRVRIVSKQPRCRWNLNMDKFLNTTMTVDRVVDDYYLMVEDNGNWCWDDNMIIGLADEPVNLMPYIAERLGVKIGQEFDIEGSCYNPHKITEEGLIDCNRCVRRAMLHDLLTGEWKIVEKPWKPKDGERIFYIDADGDIMRTTYCRNTFTPMLLCCGNCFRTEQEAEANRENIMEKFGWK